MSPNAKRTSGPSSIATGSIPAGSTAVGGSITGGSTAAKPIAGLQAPPLPELRAATDAAVAAFALFLLSVGYLILGLTWKGLGILLVGGFAVRASVVARRKDKSKRKPGEAARSGRSRRKRRR